MMINRPKFLSKCLSAVMMVTMLAACRSIHPLHRRQTVIPDSKPTETPFTTPVQPVTITHVVPEEMTPVTWQDRMRKRLDAVMTDSLLLTTQVGICIYDLTDDNLLYSANAYQRMRPASCQKLVTSISALALLGTDYRYTPMVLKPGQGWCWDDAVTGMTDFGAKGKRSSADILYKETKERTLGEVLVPMMKHSDNLLAESMLWQLPRTQDLNGLSLKVCQEKVAEVMRAAGVNPDDYAVADGSGLSLYNYISPYALVMLLRYAHANSDIFNALYPSLPVAGVDGTLQNRMQGSLAEGNVRAKTGTVTGVSSLSGYVTAHNGHLLCFSIINQGVVKTAHGRSFQDRICLVMASSVD